MKCPHCLTDYHSDRHKNAIGDDGDNVWHVLWEICPSCGRNIVYLQAHSRKLATKVEFLVYPKSFSRAPLSKHIPDSFANDYKEACLTLTDSPKASAALSRRCLQHLLREKAKVKKSDLSKEIDEILQSKNLPSYLTSALDAVRAIGNFGTHPIKSKNTGEIVEVEPGEAEWLLNLLEGLFDFYFVQPEVLRIKREALNQKLTDVGKPPIKSV